MQFQLQQLRLDVNDQTRVAFLIMLTYYKEEIKSRNQSKLWVVLLDFSANSSEVLYHNVKATEYQHSLVSNMSTSGENLVTLKTSYTSSTDCSVGLCDS